jgi:Uma2 family endonuclease
MQAAESLIFKQRARWTRERFDHLAGLGAFENMKVELVRGELVDMSPQGLPHANVIEYLNEVLMPALVGRARVRVQLPFAVDDETELIPDLAIIDKRAPKTDHPSGALLVIEVADTSARYDRIVKAPLYAQAGVREYWLIDTTKAQVEVFSGARARSWARHEKVSRGELPVPGFPEVVLRVDALFR